MPAFSQDLCILGKVFSPSQGTLLAEPGEDTESHDLILDQASEREFAETKTQNLPKTLGSQERIPPSTGISSTGCVQTVFCVLSKDLRELVYMFLRTFTPCQVLNSLKSSLPSLEVGLHPLYRWRTRGMMGEASGPRPHCWDLKAGLLSSKSRLLSDE